MLIPVGSTATKGLGLTSFSLELALLALQTFEFKGLESRKIVAEIIIASSPSIATIAHLIMSKSFAAPRSS